MKLLLFARCPVKKLFCIILSLFLFICSAPGVCAQPIESESALYTPSISAKSAVLIDADSGRILFEKNADERMGMASTTKLMTALVALELAHSEDIISVPAEAVGVEGSSIYLVEGETLTLEELLYALLLSSANDAAVAIAVSLAGSVESFADKMNDHAQALGLRNTHFSNPHGLYDEEHYTTAAELGLIAAEALRHETVRRIVSTKKATIPHNGIPDTRLLVNHNKMLTYYDGAIGMKTGFTKRTGRCLVSAATRDGMTLIAVTLNAPDDWHDHTSLLDFGFENFERKIFYAAGAFSYALPLCDSNKESVSLTNTEPLTLTVKQGAEISSVTVEAPFRFMVGKTYRGRLFGRVTVCADGQSVTSALSFAENTEGRTKRQIGFFERIYTFFLIDG